MSGLLLSTTILASFLGGVLALLAPCCVSVMLPAYFASGFRQRSKILGMTFVFAGGVATLVLPIALGATFISRLVLGNHKPVFLVMGSVMVAFGVAMALGRSFKIPMITSAPRAGTDMSSVYLLGLFSGAASVCCAPVLAGVVALAGAAASFGLATLIGITYVFGMVAPLAVLALVWDRRDWGSARVFRPGTVRLPLGRWSREASVAGLLSGLLLSGMGLLTLALAFRGPSMGGGWQTRATAWMQHQVAVFERNLAFLPGWVSSVAILGALVALAVAAVRSSRPGDGGADAVSHAAATTAAPHASCCANETPQTSATPTAGLADTRSAWDAAQETADL